MTPKPRLSMVELWRSQDPREWDYCESELYDAYVKPANRGIERELERPGLRERIARMDAAEFYAFLRDEYFLWKFTSGAGAHRQSQVARPARQRWDHGPARTGATQPRSIEATSARTRRS